MFTALSMETVKFGKNFRLLLNFDMLVGVAQYSHFHSRLHALRKKKKYIKIVSDFWRENDWRPKHLFLTQVI